MTINFKAPDIKELKPRILVLGVGGAGGNAINGMIDSGLQGVEFIAVNTDAQDLRISKAQAKIQMGMNLTKGLGAGAKLDIGQAAADESLNDIVNVLQGSNMDFITAASMSLTYGTSSYALFQRANIKENDVVLIHGATGGVGITAIEISKAVGAKVIATASTDEKLKIAKEYGADYCINYSQNEFKDKVKEYTDGKGANIIYDPVGGDVFNQSLRCIAWNGIILVIGFASGTIASAPTNLPLLKNCSIVGVFWGAWREREPNGHNVNMEKILKWWKENKVKPKVSKVFNLEDTKYALQALINREVIGKAVIKVR